MCWICLPRPSLTHHLIGHAEWCQRQHYVFHSFSTSFHVYFTCSGWTCTHLWKSQSASDGPANPGILWQMQTWLQEPSSGLFGQIRSDWDCAGRNHKPFGNGTYWCWRSWSIILMPTMPHATSSYEQPPKQEWFWGLSHSSTPKQLKLIKTPLLLSWANQYPTSLIPALQWKCSFNFFE